MSTGKLERCEGLHGMAWHGAIISRVKDNFWTKLLHQNILEGKHYSFVGMLIITVTIG